MPEAGIACLPKRRIDLAHHSESVRCVLSRKTKELSEARRKAEAPAIARRKFLAATGAAAVVCVSGYGLHAVLNSVPAAVSRMDFDPAATTYETDVVIGKDSAPVTVLEYASLTCVHCARFHAESLEAFVGEWVVSGKARILFRHFPLDATALAAAGMVSSLPAEDRAAAVSRLMAGRSSWPMSDDPAAAAAALLDLRPSAEARARKAYSDTALQQKVLEPVAVARNAGVNSTPTFVVNRKVYKGFMSAEALGAIVDAELAGRKTA